MPIHKVYDRSLFKKWTPKMAYVLGFIFADGTVFVNRRGGHFLEVTSTDLELIRKLRNIFNSNHAIGIRPIGLNSRRKKVSYRIQIGSKELLSDLLKLGIFQNKSLTVKYPDIPKTYQGNFIRGYFDGDGNVSLGNYFRKDRQKWTWVFSSRFTSESKKFLIGLKKALGNYIKGGHIQKKSDNSGYELVLSQLDSVALFKLMYNNVPESMYLKRKYNVFRKAFGALNFPVEYYAGVV